MGASPCRFESGQRYFFINQFKAAIAKERNDYAAFRAIARPSFPEQSARLALSLTGDVPEDTGRFITVAHASYGAAGKAPYAEKLTKHGFTPAILAAHIAGLNDLTGTSGEQDQAQGDAIEDTSVRDAAYDALRTYMKELKGVAKGAVRGKHGLLSKLGF